MVQGQRGNAIADVLLGHEEPGGRLPQSWPIRLEDTVAFGNPQAYPGADGKVRYEEGVFIGYRHYQHHKIAPLFQFGHGLSYTRFEVGAPGGLPSVFEPGDILHFELPVRNTGERAGQLVLQVFVRDEICTVLRPEQELKAFAKFTLAPNETGVAEFSLPMRAFAFFDDGRQAWVAEAGTFKITVATSAQATQHTSQVQLTRDWVDAVGA